MFDLTALRAALQGREAVARVVIAGHDGSSPRETGAAMLVWDGPEAGGQSGTIGGGALEWEAARDARAMLAREAQMPRLVRQALGPHLGQCCGGAVTLLTEIWRAADLADLADQRILARPVSTDAAEMPLAVRRMVMLARAQGALPEPTLVQGWMVEPMSLPRRELWIWGAGHVGRALVAVLSPLPDLAITWIDTARARFPDQIPEGVTPLWAENPADLAAHAPPQAEHLILTYSHALDLELCHRLLARGAAAIGLIGSETKWARFRSRLAALGHSPGQITRIRCPIGDKQLGKHPQAIALGVATALITPGSATGTARESAE